MFAGSGCCDRLLRVVVGIAANGNGVEAFVREQRVEVVIDGDFAAVFCAEFRGIEFARGTNRGDLRLLSCVDGRNVRGRDPAITEDADVVFFSWKRWLGWHRVKRPMSKEKL